MDKGQTIFNDRLLQIILLAIIIALGLLLLLEVSSFLPGLLGGITLYILFRAPYFRLVYMRKWKKGLTALLFILISLVVISIPIYISVKLISPKINEIVNNQDKIIAGAKTFSDKIENFTGFKIFTEQTARDLSQKLTAFIPKLVNSTASVLTNLIMMFFLLYYL